MRTKVMSRLLCLFAALLLCGTALSASAASLTPLEDMDAEDMYYTLRIPQAGVSVYVPVGAGTQVMMDNQEQYALSIGYPELPTTAFVFFALRNDDLDGMEIAGMDDDGMEALVRTISNYPELVEWEVLDDVLPDQSVVLMKEARPGSYAEHLVALHGPWVFNAMAGIMSDETELDEAAVRHQRSILSMTLDTANLAAQFHTYTFPNSGITLSVPESTHMMLLTDEPDFKYIAVAQPGTSIVAVQVYAYRDEAFQGQDVTTLDEDILEELMAHMALDGYDEASVRLAEDLFEGMPVLAYESAFGSGGEFFQHLLALHEGWRFNVVLPPFDTDREWAAEAQQAILGQLLTGEGEVPELAEENAQIYALGNSLFIPLGQGFGVVEAPEDYIPLVQIDTNAYRQVIITEDSPDSKDIELILEQDTFAGGASDFFDLADKAAALSAGRAFAQSLEEQSGLSIACDYAPDGPWGQPLLSLVSEDWQFLLCISRLGDYMLQIRWIPSETGRPFTEEEQQALLEGIGLIQ